MKTYELLLTLQRKRRITAINLGVEQDLVAPGIGFVEEAVLDTLDHVGSANVYQLAQASGVERSWMSRVVSALLKQQLIKADTPVHDKRSKLLSITKTGQAALTALDRFTNQVMTEVLQTLSTDQVGKLAKYIELLNENLGVPAQNKRDLAHAVHIELARLSRAIGIFGASVLNSGLSITECHLLYLIEAAGTSGVLATELSNQLPFDTSTISRTLTAFEKKAWVTRTQLHSDKRALKVLLLKSGKLQLSNFRKIADRVFTKAQSSLQSEQQIEFTSLLELATSQMPFIIATKSTGSYLKVLNQANEISQAKLLLGSAARPLDNRETILGLIHSDKLVAVARVQQVNKVTHVELTGSNLEQADWVSLLEGSLRHRGRG